MLGIWGSSALFGAISMLLSFSILAIIVWAVGRGMGDSVLCMDCQQCVSVCPVKDIMGTKFMGPKEIMQAARADNKRMAEEGNLFSCTSCIACVEQCPRGLDVKHTMDLFRYQLAQEGMGQYPAHKAMISRVRKVGNPYGEKGPIKSVEAQAEDIRKHMIGYAKRVGVDLSESGKEAS